MPCNEPSHPVYSLSFDGKPYPVEVRYWSNSPTTREHLWRVVNVLRNTFEVRVSHEPGSGTTHAVRLTHPDPTSDEATWQRGQLTGALIGAAETTGAEYVKRDLFTARGPNYCTACGGDGYVSDGTCPACKGSGASRQIG